jgi:hypothetical protein
MPEDDIVLGLDDRDGQGCGTGEQELEGGHSYGSERTGVRGGNMHYCTTNARERSCWKGVWLGRTLSFAHGTNAQGEQQQVDRNRVDLLDAVG